MDDDTIRKIALSNAVKFKGKANPGAVVGKLIADDPSVKEGMKEINPRIQKIVKEVNSMAPDEQKKMLLVLNPAFHKEEKERKEQNKAAGLPLLEGAKKGKVVTRMPPGPSKYPHAGHAVSFAINYLYAKERIDSLKSKKASP
jgi:glutamyl-tRNA synthetase